MLSSPLIPLLPICFTSLFSSLHQISHSHSPFSFPLLSCHSLFLSLLLLKTFSISAYTFSIKLAYQFSFGFFSFKTLGAGAGAGEAAGAGAARLLYSPHKPPLAGALLILHVCTDFSLSPCLPSSLSPLSLTYKQQPICAQKCIVFILTNVDGRLGSFS